MLFRSDTLACPHSAKIALNKGLILGNGEKADTLYQWKVESINGDTNQTLKGFKYGIINNQFNPAAASGRWLISYKASKPCYQESTLIIRVQDTVAIQITSNPDTAIMLPKTSFNFTANTTATRIHWDFGTGDPSDTATLNPINWSFANTPATYQVSVQSFHPKIGRAHV